MSRTREIGMKNLVSCAVRVLFLYNCTYTQSFHLPHGQPARDRFIALIRVLALRESRCIGSASGVPHIIFARIRTVFRECRIFECNK